MFVSGRQDVKRSRDQVGRLAPPYLASGITRAVGRHRHRDRRGGMRRQWLRGRRVRPGHRRQRRSGGCPCDRRLGDGASPRRRRRRRRLLRDPERRRERPRPAPHPQPPGRTPLQPVAPLRGAPGSRGDRGPVHDRDLPPHRAPGPRCLRGGRRRDGEDLFRDPRRQDRPMAPGRRRRGRSTGTQPVGVSYESIARTREITSSVNSVVPAWPPRSGVLTPAAVAPKTAS